MVSQSQSQSVKTVKVPNSDLPDVETPGTGKITEPGKPAVEVPNVTTPGKFTPETPTDTNPVAPVTPDTNGDSGQDKPAPATQLQMQIQ